MFINCKHCGSLVATDPVTDAPPERCPRCRGALRGTPPASAPSVATLLRPPAPEATAPVPPAPSPPSPPLPVVSPAPPGAPLPSSEVPRTEAPSPPAKVPADHVDPPGDVLADADPVSPAPSARGAAPASGRAPPSFARRLRPGTLDAPRQRRWLIAGVAALSALLVLQLLLADRARLAADPAWRPLLTAVCGVLRCGLPPWREPDALTLLARDVRPDPQAPARLQVSATFRNDARWAQGWPHLRLTLSDVDGRTVGARTFVPDEYLAGTARVPTLGAGHSADVRLTLHEPDGHAVSFAFDFE